MRRTNVNEVRVDSPSAGLITRIPSGLTGRALADAQRSITVAQNVRAYRGVLANAPGHERVVPMPSNLDSPAYLIRQANILSADPEARTAPLICTGGKMFVVRRGSRPLVCDVDDSFWSQSKCAIRFAWIGGSAGATPATAAVSELVKSWSPSFIVHTGDAVQADAGALDAYSLYEQQVAQFYASFIGGYNGEYGFGPEVNKFFPIAGQGETSASLEVFDAFYSRPAGSRWFDFKRGPCHIIVLDSTEILANGGSDGHASVQYAWCQNVLANTDCAWPLVFFYHSPYSSAAAYTPGESKLRWPFAQWGARLVGYGQGSLFEICYEDSEMWMANGLGGQSAPGALVTPRVTGSLFSYGAPDVQNGAVRIEANYEQMTLALVGADGTQIVSQLFTYPHAGGACYISDAARIPLRLTISPDTATLEIYKSRQFRAVATYEDGTTEDVTDRSAWAVGDGATASVSVGLVQGLWMGATTVSAGFEDLSAMATVTVTARCVDIPLDLVLCVDRCGSAWQVGELVEAARRLVDALDAQDNVSLITFGGDVHAQIADVSKEVSLTSDHEDVKIHLSGGLAPTGGRAMSAALTAALAELTSERARANAFKAAVVLTNGPGNISSGYHPSGDFEMPAAIAASLAEINNSTPPGPAPATKALPGVVMIGGLLVPSAYDEHLSSIATEGLYFRPDDIEEFLQDAQDVPKTICSGGYSLNGGHTGGGTTWDPPGDPPGTGDVPAEVDYSTVTGEHGYLPLGPGITVPPATGEGGTVVTFNSLFWWANPPIDPVDADPNTKLDAEMLTKASTWAEAECLAYQTALETSGATILGRGPRYWTVGSAMGYPGFAGYQADPPIDPLNPCPPYAGMTGSSPGWFIQIDIRISWP